MAVKRILKQGAPDPPERPTTSRRGFRAQADLTAEAATEALRAKAELAKKGMVLAPRPEYDVPSLPEGLTDLDDPSLMELFVKLNAWNSHVGGELALVEIDEREAEAELEFAEASALVLKWGERKSKDDTITLAKAERDSDPKVIEAREKLHGIYARRKLTQVIYVNTEKDASVVSRELTRRVGRNDRESRESRWRP
jgi:hypothetical protein